MLGECLAVDRGSLREIRLPKLARRRALATDALSRGFNERRDPIAVNAGDRGQSVQSRFAVFNDRVRDAIDGSSAIGFR